MVWWAGRKDLILLTLNCIENLANTLAKNIQNLAMPVYHFQTY